ncbi:MAG: type II secretion system F family protein [Actinomycetia bacterium]|nr:type II secretion system F family protein [Actinomycetes bacterium]
MSDKPEKAQTDRTLSASVLSQLFANLQLVYHSGLSLNEGFAILRDSASTAFEKRIMAELYEMISSGGKLSQAMRQVGGIPQYAQSLVVVAEQTGKMEDTCAGLATYYAKRDRLSAFIRSSLIYPLVMMAMIIIVVVMLLTAAMPIFDQVFAQLGFEMKGVAGTLLSVGNWLRSASLYFCAALVLLVAVVIALRATTRGKKFFSWIFQNFPLTRGLSFRLSVQRFMLALSAMLRSGTDSNYALELASGLVENTRATRGVEIMRQCSQDGQSFQRAVMKSGFLPTDARTLITVGFRTGSDAEAFERIGESISLSTERQVANLVAMIEPTLVAIMCVLVGAIMLSVMLPLIGTLASF